ncbi:hypothetical protein DRO34_06430 [Candidatus Bathyarchaeota archaeon]|nr:MAG: hypothetical protein DRO34_06430 [Candidatus Bathyarchaeota archaeon]
MLGSLIQEAHGAYLARGGWWTEIPPEFRMLFALANFIFNLIVISGFLYMAGRLVVGGKRATYTDAFVITLLGTFFESACFFFIPWRILALLLSVVIWLALIKNFYETGWLGAIAVAVLAVIVFLIISLILAVVFQITEIVLERWLISPLLSTLWR